MTHEEVLNMILAKACPSESNGDTRVFQIHTHCVMFEVTAELVSTKDAIQYNILSVTMPEEI